MTSCQHEDYPNEMCTQCGEKIDKYGNTESCFRFCCFPNCGCDGARLCMVGEANDQAMTGNVEGMWSGKTLKQRAATAQLIVAAIKESK